jgi:hypothetical protein
MEGISKEAIQRFIDSVLSNEKLSDKQKKDRLYEMDCILYTNLGLDSTQKEFNQVKSNSRLIYKGIREIDKEEGTLLLNSMDLK